MKVIDLSEKLDLVIMRLGLRTQKQLAVRLGIDSAAIAHWKRNSEVPAERIKVLADLIHASPADFVTLPWQQLPESATTGSSPWNLLRQRARHDLLALQRIAPGSATRPTQRPAALAFGGRGLLAENADRPLPPESGEVFKVDERIYLEVLVPWQCFNGSQRLNLLLFMSDAGGARAMLPEPLVLKRTQSAIKVPKTAPQDRFKIASPVGQHAFFAVYLDGDPAALKLNDVNSWLRADTLTDAQLDSIANSLLALEQRHWLISEKRFFVVRI